MYNLINLKTKTLSHSDISLNTWITIPSPWVAEILVQTGFDVLTIDMQHGLGDYNTVSQMLSIISTHPVFPIVRVPWNDPAVIMRMLDAGALGIISPMINNPSDAKLFVDSCKYPPLGHRSIGPIRPNLIYGQGYYSHANDYIRSIAMIETKEAIDNIESIVSVEGLDGVYIGTFDLSLHLGIEPLGDLDSQVLHEAIERVVAVSKENDKLIGMHARSIDEISRVKNMGIKLITPMNDSRLLEAAARDVVIKARSKLEDG